MSFKLDNINSKNINSLKREDSFDVDSILKKEITLFGSSFSNKLKESFYVELGVLLKAGISLKDAVGLLKDSFKKKQQKDLLDKLINGIVSGSSFSEVLLKEKEFSDYEYFSIKIGEETGTLSVVCDQLGDFYQRKNEQRRNLISALTYPIIILTTAILVVIFMLQFVVPMFQDIFKQQNVELPYITKLIINFSEFIKNYGGLLFLLLIAIVFLHFLFKKKVFYKRIKDTLLLKFPYVGKFIKTIYLSQFTQAVSLLTASKVPLVNSIQLVKQMMDFYPLQKALLSIEQQLLKGDNLSVSLQSHKLFDYKMIAMVKVAEETNQTEFIFKRLNEQYNTEVSQQSKILSTLLEPFIILFVGFFVGVILISMYLPMFKLSTVLG